MATRSVYKFKDENKTYRVYKHWDGYPEAAVTYIEKALDYAWTLPRFEPDEFACAFIAANKKMGGGDFRLITDDVVDMWQDYEYTISLKNGELFIEFNDVNKDGNVITFTGTLSDMKKYIAETK
jgi:hypothetical protein